LGPMSLGHGSRRAAQLPPCYAGARKCSAGKYAGSRKCSAKICWGTEVQCEKNMLGHGKPPRLASAPLLSRQVPARLLACCALPCPSLISIHTPISRGRTFVLGLAKRLASSRRSSLPRTPRFNVAVSVTPAEGPSCCWRYIGLGT
jgi:hypothetical protein